jgi:hypothetical protein
VNMLDSDPAVITGRLKVYFEHLKSANYASQLATNKFFLVLAGLALRLSVLMAEVELSV